MTDLLVDFHVMTRRYKCVECEKTYQKAKLAAEAVAESMGLTVQRSDTDAGLYTFQAMALCVTCCDLAWAWQ